MSQPALEYESYDAAVTDDDERVECPKCYGIGRNRFGGPCRHCHATGQVELDEQEDVGFFVPTLLATWPTIVVRAIRRLRGRPPTKSQMLDPFAGDDEQRKLPT